jgi:integrase
MTAKKDSKGRNLKQNEDQLKDGRYRYRYTDKYGKRQAVYSWKLVTTDKTPIGKKEDLCLREKIKKIEKDCNDGINTYMSQSSVNDLVMAYLDLKIKLAITTKNNYIHIWEKNIKDSFLGKMRLCDVKKSDIQRFYADLYENKKFSVGTIQLYQNLLFPVFQMAVDDSIIRLNPCRNCMKDYTQGSMSSNRIPLTKQEQSILLNFTKDNNFYSSTFSLLAFLLGTGCRISEALGMTWDNINFEEKYVEVDHQILYKKKDDKIVYFSAPTKTKKSRKIPLQNNLIEILRRHQQETYFISKASVFEVDGYKDFVFINREGKLKTPNTIVRTLHGIRNMYNKEESENAIEECREPILLPTFTPHTLRHTFCTRMAETGIDIKVLQEIMGHANITVTMQVYNHATFERVQKAVEGTENILKVSV